MAILSAPMSIRIDGGPGAPRDARIAVLLQIEGHVSEANATDAALIVSELVSNSVLHANVGPDQTLTVQLLTLEDRLRITVIDSGSVLEPCIRPPDQRTSGGLGLCIVDQVSAAWGFARDADGRTRVWSDLLIDAGPRR